MNYDILIINIRYLLLGLARLRLRNLRFYGIIVLNQFHLEVQYLLLKESSHILLFLTKSSSRLKL